jgi:hypothetical protein
VTRRKEEGKRADAQQPGIKRFEISSTSNRPSPETALKAETGWSVWAATA